MQCKAKSKQSGQRCKRHACPGREVCAMHGGKSLRGMDSPTFKTGRYSKDAPARLHSRYMAGLDDPELTSLRDEIALVDARTAELLQLASVSGEHQTLVDARESIDQAFAIIAKPQADAQSLYKALEALKAILHRPDDAETWKAINANLDLRAKLATGETNRLKLADQFITVAEAQLIQYAMLRSIEMHVADEATRRAIGQDFAKIFAAREGR